MERKFSQSQSMNRLCKKVYQTNYKLKTSSSPTASTIDFITRDKTSSFCNNFFKSKSCGNLSQNSSIMAQKRRNYQSQSSRFIGGRLIPSDYGFNLKPSFSRKNQSVMRKKEVPLGDLSVLKVEDIVRPKTGPLMREFDKNYVEQKEQLIKPLPKNTFHLRGNSLKIYTDENEVSEIVSKFHRSYKNPETLHHGQFFVKKDKNFEVEDNDIVKNYQGADDSEYKFTKFMEESQKNLDLYRELSGDKCDVLRQQLFNMQSDAKWGVINYHKINRLSMVKTPANKVLQIMKQQLAQKIEKALPPGEEKEQIKKEKDEKKLPIEPPIPPIVIPKHFSHPDPKAPKRNLNPTSSQNYREINKFLSGYQKKLCLFDSKNPQKIDFDFSCFKDQIISSQIKGKKLKNFEIKNQTKKMKEYREKLTKEGIFDQKIIKPRIIKSKPQINFQQFQQEEQEFVENENCYFNYKNCSHKIPTDNRYNITEKWATLNSNFSPIFDPVVSKQIKNNTFNPNFEFTNNKKERVKNRMNLRKGSLVRVQGQLQNIYNRSTTPNIRTHRLPKSTEYQYLQDMAKSVQRNLDQTEIFQKNVKKTVQQEKIKMKNKQYI